ncbi:MAG: hypothetical protein QOE09_1364 [Ilumatobacteraceae bacterium]|jgi:hypothetical protein
MTTSSNRRHYREAVLKKLFALSRNSCAFPRCEEVLSKPEWSRVLAKVCHIAGLNEGSARHDPAMKIEECNDYPNLLLLCPNHHDLIDVLEPERFDVDDLLDMKRAHESHRPGDRPWYSEELGDEFVAKLVVTLGLTLVAPGERPREPIRSGTAPLPDPLPPREPQVPPRDRSGVVEINRDWPRGARKVRELASELDITQREVLELCGELGIRAGGRGSTLSEPYADMVRRRVRRDGSTRPASRQVR